MRKALLTLLVMVIGFAPALAFAAGGGAGGTGSGSTGTGATGSKASVSRARAGLDRHG